jgi:periplasmic protein CpxP/Spy
MKKVLLLTGTLLWMVFLSAIAQPPQPPAPEEMAKMETDAMKTELKLTADQLPKVEAINLKYARKMGEMFEQGPPADFTEMQKKMQDLETQKKVEFSKILNADQLKKYDTMMEERRKNMPGPPM